MQQRSEETKTHLLEAAQRLFSQNGYDATGVAEICAAAGVSKGAFYHHFPTKQAVFLELLDRWLVGVTGGLNAIRQEAPSVPEMILKMSAMLPLIFQAADGRLPMFLEYWLQASRDDTVRQASIAPYHQYQEYFADLIRDGIAEGSLRAIDPKVAAQLIVSLAMGLLLQGLLDPQSADWPAVARESLVLLMEGMARKTVASDQ